jgi:hypothetical protein
MSTLAQVLANQVNAQRSTGPRTPEGKSVASRNSIKHGLSGKSVLIPGEDPEEFEAHLQEYTALHKPATIDEEFLVKQMAGTMWRIQRLGRFEVAIYEKAPDANPFADPACSAELLTLNRYEKSLESSYFRSIRELRAIRKDQAATIRAEEKKEAAEAKAEKAAGDARVLAQLEAYVRPPTLSQKDREELEKRFAARRTQRNEEGI